MIDENETMNFEENVHIIEAMLRQERSGYVVLDYLRHLPNTTAFGRPIDAEARFSIADWMAKIMDICQYKRETAAIAMSFLDRFVSTPDGHQVLLDRQQFQLAALTCVYTSVKIHEQQALAPHLVAKLSGGSFSTQDIEAMERRMLQALQWRVNPPTAMGFVRQFLELLPPNGLDLKSRQVIIELAQYQVEVSVVEYDFCTRAESHIAYAALLNAVESVYSDGILCTYVESLVSHSSARFDCHSTRYLRDELYEAILVSSQTNPEPLHAHTLRKPFCGATYNSKLNSASTFTKSPRSVQLP